MKAPWAVTVDTAAEAFDVDLSVGLSNEEVAERRERHGWNELQKEPATPLWRLVLAQFDDMLVKVRIYVARDACILHHPSCGVLGLQACTTSTHSVYIAALLPRYLACCTTAMPLHKPYITLKAVLTQFTPLLLADFARCCTGFFWAGVLGGWWRGGGATGIH